MARDLSLALDPAETLRRESVCPRSLVRAGLALDGVRAILHSSLFAHTSPLPLAYRNTEVYPLASRLWDRWRAMAP